MHSAHPTLSLPISDRDHLQGSRNAPVVLVEYGDYQCPRCGQAFGVVKQLQQGFTQQLGFVFRNLPLTQLHPQAQHAAEAAEAAAAQGKFWQMHDLLFEHQTALEDGCLVEYASWLELDISQFLRDLSSHIYVERVYRDLESAVGSGVKTTPAFFINGCYQDDWNLEILLSAIEQVTGTETAQPFGPVQYC
jgi:protein-disulfide isomerase